MLLYGTYVCVYTDRQTDTQRERQTDTQTHAHKQRERYPYYVICHVYVILDYGIGKYLISCIVLYLYK